MIAAAGDIACGPGGHSSSSCRHQATSDLLVGAGLAAVLPLGDIQYERGSLDAFQTYYDPTWGRVKSITRPAVGNHEYGTAGAAGYFSYFGAAAGTPGQGWYSYDVGDWHLIALNSNCGSVRLRARIASGSSGCGRTSPRTGPAARSPTGTTRASRRARTATAARRTTSGPRSTRAAPTWS